MGVQAKDDVIITASGNITATQLMASTKTLVVERKREMLLEEPSTWNVASNAQYLNGYLDGLAAILNLLTGKDHEDIRAELDAD